MAFTYSTTTKLANRLGLDMKVYDYTDGSVAANGSELLTIDFVNVTDINVTGDRTWATGGQEHANKIAFNNPLEGSFKVSTQIMTADLLDLCAGTPTDLGTAADIVFKNDTFSMPKYYTIVANTIWQDDEGNLVDEVMTFHKVCPRRAFNISYSGDGDPMSMDVEFDLLQDDNKKVVTVSRTAHVNASSGT